MMGEKVVSNSFVDARAYGIFAALHVGVCAVAVAFGSGKAFLAVLVVSLLAGLRYFCIVYLARNLGRSRQATVIAVSGWIAAFMALASVLFVLGRAGRVYLDWAVIAAVVGPIATTASVLIKGVIALVDRRSGEEAAV
jgi:hypothetical protein